MKLTEELHRQILEAENKNEAMIITKDLPEYQRIAQWSGYFFPQERCADTWKPLIKASFFKNEGAARKNLRKHEITVFHYNMMLRLNEEHIYICPNRCKDVKRIQKVNCVKYPKCKGIAAIQDVQPHVNTLEHQYKCSQCSLEFSIDFYK